MSSKPRGWWLRAAVVSGGIAGLTLAHFTTSVHAQGVHAILFKATLVPLVLAGLWFGIRGAALASVLTTALYLLHIFVQLAPLRDRRRAREPRHDVDEGGVPDITDMR